jgi:predicted AAA+ superfamily ATPase
MKIKELGETLYGTQLPAEIEAFLTDTNPWWLNKPSIPLPPFRRWLFSTALQRLKDGLAPVIVLRGPRQVGKTTLQQQLIEHLIGKEGVEPNRILRIQFDEIPSLKRFEDPILSLCRWFESRILRSSFNEMAKAQKPAYVFFDEVQNLSDWSPQIKALVDHHSVRVLLTGSSALRIEYGRDSLAGRITTLELGTFLLREIAELHNIGDIPALLPKSNG